MEDGRGHGLHLQSVYDTASALPGTTPVLLLSARSGRRTGKVTANRIAKEGAFDAGVRPLLVRPRRGVLAPLRVEALELGTDLGRCIVFQRRRMFVILTLRCRCPKPLSHGTPRRAYAVDGNRAAAQKSR